ncbi:MAG: SAM-dependent methyltransferase [Terracidiphilus sp.]
MLLDFLMGLATNEKQLARFKTNREKAIREAKLNARERAALRSGDLARLRALAAAPGTSEFDVSQSTNMHQSYQTFHVLKKVSSKTSPTFWKPVPPLEFEGLTVVGTGIRGGLQMTVEARNAISISPKVLYLVADKVTEALVRRLNPKAESLYGFYREDRLRGETYRLMVKKILEDLEAVQNLCVVFYGHPGVFVWPTREAIRRARSKGFKARMLPGISTVDNLFADLGVDPGMMGLQSYEATAFLVCGYRIDPSAGLILWQTGVVGDSGWSPRYKMDQPRMRVLAEHLGRSYGRNHKVVLYAAAEIPAATPFVKVIPIRSLPKVKLQGPTTLYVPPARAPRLSRRMLEKLRWKYESPGRRMVG